MKNGNHRRGLAREERLQIMLSPRELKAVDNFRFAHRMPSRAAAVRELLRFGIAAAGSEVIENTGIKSGDYGVLAEAKLEVPADQRPILGGRRGHHSEHLGHLLAVMQFLPRTYPDASW